MWHIQQDADDQLVATHISISDLYIVESSKYCIYCSVRQGRLTLCSELIDYSYTVSSTQVPHKEKKKNNFSISNVTRLLNTSSLGFIHNHG
jgi:hypothetical protein